MKFCNANNCDNPVFGKGFCKSHQYMREDYDRRSIVQRGIDKRKAEKKLRPGTFVMPEENKSGVSTFIPTEFELEEQGGYDGEKTDYVKMDEMALWDNGKGIDDSIANLTADLDSVLSLYIRHRAANEKGFLKCFCCGKEVHIKDAHNSHYVRRGHNGLRFLEQNCKESCADCNQLHNTNEQPYTDALEKESPGTPAWLKEQSILVFKPSRAYLKELLIEYRNKLTLVKKKV